MASSTEAEKYQALGVIGETASDSMAVGLMLMGMQVKVLLASSERFDEWQIST